MMRFRQPPNVQYIKVAKQYGIELKDNSVFLPNFKTAYRSATKEFPNFGAQVNMHWSEWWHNVVKNTFVACGVPDDPTLDTVAKQLIQLYSTLQGWEVIPGVNTLLETLKANGKNLGVISNMDPRIHKLLRESKLSNYFDFVLCSYEVNCSKPNEGIFRKALAAFGQPVKPTECCHVGDSHAEDFLGATSSGWEAVYVNEGKFLSSAEPEHPKSIEYLKDHLLGRE